MREKIRRERRKKWVKTKDERIKRKVERNESEREREEKIEINERKKIKRRGNGRKEKNW